MDAYALLSELRSRGIALIPRGENLMAEPASLLSETDRVAIRQSKSDLLRILSKASAAASDEDKGAHSGQTGPSNSRYSLVTPEVRELIEAIEPEARAKGWPAELLWNSEFWGAPRGLAAVLDEGDAIAEVTTDYIAIYKVEHNILRFQRRVS